MKTLALLCAVFLLAPAAVHAAKVYKWTDSQGNVIYSDTPRPGAVQIEVPTEPAGIVPVPPEQMRKPEPPAGGVVGYRSLIVASPSNEEVLVGTAGSVNVALTLEPALRVSEAHAIRLRLDGQALEARYTAADITISGVPRGGHTLQAEVVERSGAVLIASAPVTFFLQEPSSEAPAGPDIYDPVYPPQPYPPTYKPVYPPQPYPPQGRPKPN